MEDARTALLWSGMAGWFLFTFLLTSGNGKGWLRNLFVTAFYWIICVDFVAILLRIVLPVVHKAGVGWRFVVFFVALPYVLGGLRLCWLLRAERKKRLEVSF